ncbi:hypothetical protein GCM10018785_36710 [Streptomyces longispororuber]|uniref:Beta-lactamase n=1 Tax=Streptomyces longispororuber TaxID=68230 RepID=A0A918ZR84_9ACTN|nr:hypothetical protein GCM10018785_36710 [Streptomyces longispororuber]
MQWAGSGGPPEADRGHGNDGSRITIRQTPRHTSGLPDFRTHLRPQDVVRDPLAHRAPRPGVAGARPALTA